MSTITGTTSVIMFFAFIMDLVVWHKSHRIDIDPERKDSNPYSLDTDVNVQVIAVFDTSKRHPDSSV